MVANKLNKYSSGSALLGVLFLLAAAIVGVTLVTNKNITLNPSKKADSSCTGTCYANSCSTLGLTTATGTCSPPLYCCKSAATGTPKPTPTKSPTPRPIPTSACNKKGLGYTCHFKTSSEKECMDDAIHNYVNLGYDVVPNCCSLIDCAGGNDNCYACYVTRVYPTPTPSIQVVKITSGSCAQKCASISGTCAGVGMNSRGDDGKIMSWHNYNSCTPRPGTCNSNITKLPSGGITCSGTLPEWTKCRCKINPYVN